MVGEWIPLGWIGVKDAAKRLGVADKTIRRKIEAGELEAKLIPSPYGRDMWVINETQIQTAQQVMDIVEVKQEYELKDVALAVAAIVRERDAERDARLYDLVRNINKPVLDEIKQLQEDNAQLRELLNKRLEEPETKKSSWLPWRK